METVGADPACGVCGTSMKSGNGILVATQVRDAVSYRYYTRIAGCCVMVGYAV